MNNFLLKQTSKTGNLDAHLFLRHNIMDPIPRFMEVSFYIPKQTQKHITQQLGY